MLQSVENTESPDKGDRRIRDELEEEWYRIS